MLKKITNLQGYKVVPPLKNVVQLSQCTFIMCSVRPKTLCNIKKIQVY